MANTQGGGACVLTRRAQGILELLILAPQPLHLRGQIFRFGGVGSCSLWRLLHLNHSRLRGMRATRAFGKGVLIARSTHHRQILRSLDPYAHGNHV